MRAPFVWAVFSFACSAGAPRAKLPDVKPAPPASLARMPGDVWAVGSVDLQPLRDATLWRWLRGIAGTQSMAVHWCSAQFDAATRATVALLGSEHGRDTVLAIVDGIDRKALAACLHGPPAHIADVPGRGECDRYDAAVHTLDHCNIVPLSLAPALHAAEVALAAGEPQTACPKAAAIVEKANARREELGWGCEPHRSDLAVDWTPELGKLVKDANPETIDLGDESVRFLDDHTAAIVIGATGKRNVLAELAAEHPHAWFEAPASTIDARASAWLVADPRRASSRPEGLPPAFTVTVELRSGVAAELKIPGLAAEMAYQWFGILENFAKSPVLAGSTVQVGCALEAPIASTPEQQACSAAIEHAEQLRGDALAGIDTKGFIPEHVERCVADHWPATLVQCLADATSTRAVAACYDTLPAADHERILDVKTLCGEHPFQLRVAVPQMRLEALKLVSALDPEPRRDCRGATKGPANELTIAPSFRDPAKRRATACFETLDVIAADKAPGACTTIDAAHGEFIDVDAAAARIGPYLADAPDFVWHAPGRASIVDLSTAATVGGAPLTLVHDAKHVELCRGKDCTKIPLHGAIDAIAMNGEGTLALVRAGAAVETWSLANHKRVAAFQLAAKDCAAMLVGDAVFAGCPGDSYLATSAGKKLAAIGGSEPIDVLADSPVWLGGTRWAFVAKTGYAVVIQDVATGAVERRIDLGHTAEPGMVTATGDGQGWIAVAYGGPGKQAGTIAFVDPSGEVQAFQRDLCPR